VENRARVKREKIHPPSAYQIQVKKYREDLKNERKVLLTGRQMGMQAKYQSRNSKTDQLQAIRTKLKKLDEEDDAASKSGKTADEKAQIYAVNAMERNRQLGLLHGL